MRNYFLVFIVLLISIANIDAQEIKNPNDFSKIVYINDRVFSDSKIGIKELIKRHEKLDAEFLTDFETLNSLRLEITNLDKRIVNYAKSVVGCISNIDELINKREKLLQNYNQKAKEGKTRYDRRSVESIDPILAKLDLVLKEFGRERGYRVVKVDSPPSNKNLDKTAEFIEFYNKRAL